MVTSARPINVITGASVSTSVNADEQEARPQSSVTGHVTFKTHDCDAGANVVVTAVPEHELLWEALASQRPMTARLEAQFTVRGAGHCMVGGGRDGFEPSSLGGVVPSPSGEVVPPTPV